MLNNDSFWHKPQHHHLEEAVKLSLRGLVPLSLLFGGIWFLSLGISGWSLIAGLPITIVGTVFSIYTYDEVITKKFLPDPNRLVTCSVCGNPTPAVTTVGATRGTVCAACSQKRSQKSGQGGNLNK